MRIRLCAMILLAWIVPATAGAERPSFLVFVLDTVRADAVSVWGEVEGTTPTIDRLAAEGVRYERAHASAPWTLPSHASLFTGLPPRRHGVNWDATRARDQLVTVAERFRDAGWETVGFSENSWLSTVFNLNQGFERFEFIHPKVARLSGALARWLRDRDASKPFFLFINVVDAHAPYPVRDENPFLPEGVSADEARAVSQEKQEYMCTPGKARELAILRGLYHGGVAAADAKLDYTLTVLAGLGLRKDLVTVVASDHGEHFGERHRFEHVAGLDQALLRVPLIVHGLPGVEPTVISSPVELASVAPSLVAWAGLESLPDVESVPLPTESTRGEGAEPGPIVAEWTDPVGGDHARDPHNFVNVHRMMSRRYREGCTPADRVFGDQRALVRYPWKLTWYERYPAELRDLREGRTDVSKLHPALAAKLAAELERRLAGPAPSPDPDPAPVEPLPEDIKAGLRALGYLE